MSRFSTKHLPLAAIAALAVSQGALAQPRKSPNTMSSSAFCRVTSISRSSAVSQDAYTNAWLDIGNYVCGEQAEETTVVNIDEQVEDVAKAIAEAFAEVSTNCRASGNADVRAQAYALAQERATAIGTAVTEIFAGAEVCGKCTAAVNAISEVSKELVAEALAEAWTEVYLLSDQGTEVSDVTTVTSDVVVETIATVLSGITGTIRAGANDGCSIDVINEAKVGDYLAKCDLSVSGDAARIIETDAMAEAGANASAYACDGDIAEAEVDVIARATAKALAEAVAEADVYCESNGGENSKACGLAEVDITVVARAQAEAFASAFAEAETCGCKVSASADVSVFDEIWVEAAANAYAEACVEGNGEDFGDDFQFAVEERMLQATARAIASAVADASAEDGASCRISANPCAATSDQCVANHRQCGGSGFDNVLPCCDPDYRCVVRNEDRFMCRHRNSRTPSFWDGRIEECTLGLAE